MHCGIVGVITIFQMTKGCSEKITCFRAHEWPSWGLNPGLPRQYLHRLLSCLCPPSTRICLEISIYDFQSPSEKPELAFSFSFPARAQVLLRGRGHKVQFDEQCGSAGTTQIHFGGGEGIWSGWPQGKSFWPPLPSNYRRGRVIPARHEQWGLG